MKRLLIILVLINLLSLKTVSSASDIKLMLEHELKTTYLSSLEKIWGNCGDGPQSCLSQHDDFMILNLEKKEICFPYTQCGFYRCMESKYKCESVGVNYFTKLAHPTCNSYVSNISENKFTQKGVEWIYTVMVCLQKGLIEECEIKGNCLVSDHLSIREKTCNHITEFTLSYHPGCYINSGVGVCKLPLKDKQAIWKTVSPYLTARERKEAYKVIFQCFIPKNNETPETISQGSVQF